MRLPPTVLLALFSAALIPAALKAQETPPAPPATPGDSRAFPAPQRVEGRYWDPRPPEKADDRPLFPQQTRAPYRKTADYKITTVTDKLRLPWSLVFLPDGKMLVSEKYPGHLRIVSPDGALSAPLTGLEMLAAKGKLGLLDVVLAPDFAKSRRIYFSFFENLGPGYSNTNLAYGTLDQAAGAVHGVTVIFRGDPVLIKNYSGKQGGRIVFARDGSLFMTMGDRDANIKADYEAALAQKLDNDMGKIIHLTADGTPAPDNPFLKTPGARPEIWAYGIRSPQGFAWGPDGTLWETEHGPRGGDELNIIRKGINYGWPVITHGIDYGGGPVNDGIIAKEGLEQPVYYWDPVIAPSGLAYYRGNLFPQWKNSLFAGALRGMGVYRLEIKDRKVVAEEPLLSDLRQRIRDVRVGPDGAVYVLTEQKALLKLTPK
ncbi:MAG TPA: PQQ-dependent sugar dehydrogenase [Rhizomicrobium sp.]|nr:PQQ-dependent sugar dehydrogenase [Rhizomicrobium sp.]